MKLELVDLARDPARAEAVQQELRSPANAPGNRVLFAVNERVKAVNDSHHRILSRLQADRIIHPEYEIGVRVAQSLTHPQMLDYISLGNGWFVVEVNVNETIASRKGYARELEFAEVRLVLVKRG
ncbi:MAG: hypothetical protein VW625_04025, partial [Perlucidibaca sp.]